MWTARAFSIRSKQAAFDIRYPYYRFLQSTHQRHPGDAPPQEPQVPLRYTKHRARFSYPFLHMKNLRVLCVQYSAIDCCLLGFLRGTWGVCGTQDASTPLLNVPFPALEVLTIEMDRGGFRHDSCNRGLPMLQKIVQLCKDIRIPLSRIRFSGLSTEDRNGLDCKVEGVDVDFI